ncbi:CAP domain-containing protein [Plebeiibacterium sediminum]|uniref:CAP domain-containing protein n=1 Tax=Plebeiibacterium sediminum TaxID=2992112 RepID=A0AAE3M292_9BACT|nr:CAP domain-containing protein [Plebeiobacterium sediminum]MCW3785631.1 CAP domain-containing protein [Plebeiobacterium sediminum]
MKYRLIIFFLLLSTLSYSQSLKTKETKVLSDLILTKINLLRVENNAGTLIIDSTLNLAAELQSNYMGRANRLTHRQRLKKYRTPFLRVAKFSKDFKLVGENILVTPSKKKSLKQKDLEVIAEEMFQGWKNSPEHFKNMIHPDYVLTGFSFSSSQDKKIYATNVFGTKGIRIKNQLSENAFGIKSNKSGCDEYLADKRNIITHLGNSFQIYDNEIRMYFHNKDLLKKIIKNEKDGIAIDVVTRSQFICDGANILDMSDIYDGIMLKPKYTNDIFSNNEAQNIHRLITTLGKVPSSFQGENIKPSLIYIKDGKVCDYAVPALVPSASYSLIDVPLKIKEMKNNPFYKKGIVYSKTYFFDFERDECIPVTPIKLDDTKGKLKSITINSYSSIEGDSLRNITLQNKRAAIIKSSIAKKLKQGINIPATIHSNENWDEMYFQLKLLGLDSIAKLERNLIRDFVVADTIHNWDSLLYIQRRSHATIEYEGLLNLKDSSYYEQNLYTAINAKNWNIASNAMAKMYEEDLSGLPLFTPYIFNEILIHKELVQNSSALLCNCFFFNTEKSVRFLQHWLTQAETLDAETKYNLSVLYCNVISNILDEWDLSTDVFLKIIPPNIVNEIIKSFEGDNNYNQLILNYHLTAMDYYGQINDQYGMMKSFNYIESYFNNIELNIEDDVALCLFFNRWSRFDLTIEHLFKRMYQKDFTEDAAFLLAQTCMAYPHKLSESDNIKTTQRAYSFNKKRWCSWINYDFQNLRFDDIKEIYCKECQTEE